MNYWEVQRKRPQFFHQKGWIATNFKVKNNLSAILKSRQKNLTQMNRPQFIYGTAPIHHKSTQLNRQSKPSTAPQKVRRKMEIVQIEQNPMNYVCDDQMTSFNESKHSNFKTTLNNRKQLLFIKPYTRNRNSSMTIDQRKSQIYREINNPDLTSFNLTFKQTGPIEYLTEYVQNSTNKSQRTPVKSKPFSQHRTSLNVLRQKLKRRCEMSFYQTKLTTLKEP